MSKKKTQTEGWLDVIRNTPSAPKPELPADLEIVSALNQQVAELERKHAKLTERIREIATATAPEYPGVADAEPWEQLYAIESAYKGTDAANGDLHKLITLMREKLGWTPLEVVEFWEASKAAIDLAKPPNVAAEKGV